jgi:hypothetical protein
LPDALATVIDGWPADPEALVSPVPGTGVPSGEAWLTLCHEVAPQDVFSLPDSVTTMLCVPDGGATSSQISVRTLPVFVATPADDSATPL